VTAVSGEALRKKPGRYEFQRGVLTRDEDGQLLVRRAGFQGSGVLSSMNAANCFIVLPEEAGPVSAGDTVTVQPFSAFV
jgi:molybdopterin molybdotransferase